MFILKRKELILVGITYYLPDYQNLLNQFYCHFEDNIPDIPRVHQFLNYWKNNIEAVIREINLGVCERHYASYRSVDALLRMN